MIGRPRIRLGSGERGHEWESPPRVVVVGDAHGAALKTAADLEQLGYEPAVFLASANPSPRLAPENSEIVIAWADATSLPPKQVLALAVERGYPPVVVVGEALSARTTSSATCARAPATATAAATSSGSKPPSSASGWRSARPPPAPRRGPRPTRSRAIAR